MTRPRQRLFALVLAIVLSGSMGLTCEDFLADPSTVEVPVQLRLEVVQTYRFVSSAYIAIVDIVVVADAPVQAVDMGISWEGPAITIASAIPHHDFDDDGKLFSTGALGTHAITGIVDLRHGAPTAQTVFRTARVALMIQNTGATSTLRATGKIAGPDGSLYDVVVSEFNTIGPPAL